MLRFTCLSVDLDRPPVESALDPVSEADGTTSAVVND